MNWAVPLVDLDFGPEEDQAVLDVLHSKWLSMGAITQRFEQEFAEYHGARHAVAVTNVTQALHLACQVLGIGPGDEVIVPAMNFVAGPNAVLYSGAQPRFADITGPEDLTIDPTDIEHQITPRTRAIIVMHYGGFPCRMPEIMVVAEKHNLRVIEDASHAPGAWLTGRALGTWGDIGCFSFFSNKNLATGEGGMLLTNRDDLAERLRLLRSHGVTGPFGEPNNGHCAGYDVVALGYNHRIDDIHAALGRTQLKKLAEVNSRRREITRTYWDALARTPLTLPFYRKDQAFYRPGRPGAYFPAHHLFPILLPKGLHRADFVEQLKAAGIQVGLHYPPVHRFTYYRERFPGLALPHTEAAAARQVTLPLYPSMSPHQVEEVIDRVMGALV